MPEKSRVPDRWEFCADASPVAKPIAIAKPAPIEIPSRIDLPRTRLWSRKRNRKFKQVYGRLPELAF
jgi:hypothetical protein